MSLSPRSYLLRLIRLRPYTRHELLSKMRLRKVDEEEAQALLDEFEEMKLIDDRAYVEMWLHQRDIVSPRGPALLRQELQKKGIAKELVDEFLGQRDRDVQLALAQELVDRKERQYAALEPMERRQKLLGLLMRRGFSYDIAKRILDI